MTPVAGGCYLLDHGLTDRHYFFVLSDPDRFPDRPLVLVPLTGVSPEKTIDGSCRLEPGEHPCCVKQSFIFYRGALLIESRRLVEFVANGKALEKPPASQALLVRLRESAERSDELPGKHREELWQQDVVQDRS